LQYFLWAASAIVLAATATSIQRKRSKISPVRRQVLDQRVIFRTRVGVKYETNIGGWSIKTLGGMELIVRENSIQVSLKFPTLGALLGSEWYFHSRDTTIGQSPAPSHNLLDRNWIIIRSEDHGSHAAVAVWSKDNNDAVWNALLASGARSS
jgi:hypothetical protein